MLFYQFVCEWDSRPSSGLMGDHISNSGRYVEPGRI